MRSEGYSRQFVCVCVCVCVCVSVVCLSITALTATYLICKAKVRYHRILYGVLQICNVWISLKTLVQKLWRYLLTTAAFHIPEELSMDRRNSSELFLRRRVCTLSDSFCRTTDSSLFSANELLSFLAWPVHIMC